MVALAAQGDIVRSDVRINGSSASEFPVEGTSKGVQHVIDVRSEDGIFKHFGTRLPLFRCQFWNQTLFSWRGLFWKCLLSQRKKTNDIISWHLFAMNCYDQLHMSCCWRKRMWTPHVFRWLHVAQTRSENIQVLVVKNSDNVNNAHGFPNSENNNTQLNVLV